MKRFPISLSNKLQHRIQSNSLRKVMESNSLIDFSSNDYLGFSRSEVIFEETHQYLVSNKMILNGATGSRLLSGNHKVYTEAEIFLADFHDSESASYSILVMMQILVSLVLCHNAAI